MRIDDDGFERVDTKLWESRGIAVAFLASLVAAYVAPERDDLVLTLSVAAVAATLWHGKYLWDATAYQRRKK